MCIRFLSKTQTLTLTHMRRAREKSNWNENIFVAFGTQMFLGIECFNGVCIKWCSWNRCIWHVYPMWIVRCALSTKMIVEEIKCNTACILHAFLVCVCIYMFIYSFAFIYYFKQFRSLCNTNIRLIIKTIPARENLGENTRAK